MREYPPVLTKRDFVRRYAEGEFGNASPTWNNIQEWKADGCPPGMFHIRNRVVGALTFYNIPAGQLAGAWDSHIHFDGLDPYQLYISAMAPTEKTLIQGEVMMGSRGLELFYSTIKKPMRDALKQQSRTACGIMACSLLRTHLCPNSYEWLHVLLERYPFHVVEFSTYSTKWGTLPNFNTVFWEVRGGY